MLLTPYPRTIARDGTAELVVKKSRFICSLRRVSSEEEARAAIDEIRKRHWGANHHCTAYRIGSGGACQRSSDDGEPAGTAGAPILSAITRRDLTDVLAVVTRYFGGVLLGAGGLVRAYGEAVTTAIAAVGIVERRPVLLLAVEASYEDAGRLEHALRASPYTLGAVEHGERVSFEVSLPEHDLSAFETWLAAATNGRYVGRTVGTTRVEVAVG